MRPPHHKHNQMKRKRKENGPRDVDIDISWAVGNFCFVLNACGCFFMLPYTFCMPVCFCAHIYK